MDEWQVLRQTALRFGSEVERVVDGNWVSMPMPLVILVDAIESEPVVRSFVEGCVDALGEPGFDVQSEVERVAETPESHFGPFATDEQTDVARCFLLIQALAERGCKYDDPLFAHYGPDAPRHQERFDRFVSDVVAPLIDATTAELARQREALGPCPYDEEPDVAVDQTSSDEPATHFEVTPELLASLVDALEATVATLPLGDQTDVRLQIEALRDELLGEQPKPRVASALVRVLRMLGKSAEFLQALAPLERAIEAM